MRPSAEVLPRRFSDTRACPQPQAKMIQRAPLLQGCLIFVFHTKKMLKKSAAKKLISD
jgi:hypothetical protein